jgi:hypothetical protein
LHFSKYGTSRRIKANKWSLRYVWLFLVYRNKGRYLDKKEILTKKKEKGKGERRRTLQMLRGIGWDGNLYKNSRLIRGRSWRI